MSSPPKLTTTVEISLAYYKQGSDMAEHLDDVKTRNAKVSDLMPAVQAHGMRLLGVSDHLRKVYEVMLNHKDEAASIDADGHCIFLTGSAALCADLIAKGLAQPVEDPEP